MDAFSVSAGYAIAASLAAGLPFLLVYTRFRRDLEVRRNEIRSRLHVKPKKELKTPTQLLGELFAKAAVKPFAKIDRKTLVEEDEDGPSPTETVTRFLDAYPGADSSSLFDNVYAPAKYTPPLITLLVVVFVLGMAVSVKLKIISIPILAFVLVGIPPHALTGAIGGYAWSLSDALDRSRDNDLPPSAFNSMWFRMLISMIAAAALAPLSAKEFQFSIALFVGAFPTQTFVRIFTNKVPGFKESAVPEDPPSLQYIQGMTETVQRRLAEERIERVQHLAYKNPILLLIRSNMDWDTVIDFIDQALLVQHIGDKVLKTRVLGVRGAIDMASLYQRYAQPDDDEDVTEALAVAAQIAKVLEVEDKTVLHLAYVLWWDPVVAFLWAQWSEKDKSTDASQSQTQTTLLRDLMGGAMPAEKKWSVQQSKPFDRIRLARQLRALIPGNPGMIDRAQMANFLRGVIPNSPDVNARGGK